MRRMLCFMLLFVLAGCSSKNVAFDPVPLNTKAPEVAEVVVIRDLTYFYGQDDTNKGGWVVALDDRNYSRLLPGQYTIFPVPTGEPHSISVKRWDVWWHKEQIQALLEPGKRYYYLTGVGDLYSTGLHQVEEEEGRAWMVKSNYVQVTRPR